MNKFFIFLILFFSTSVFADEKLTVMLDWYLNPDHAPLFVAEQEGLFKQAGLTVELIGPADPTDPPKIVAAGKADIAITYEPKYLEQVDQGLPVKRFGTLIAQPLNCLVVLKNSHILTIDDLKGKTIGYSGSGTNAITLKVMLEHHHLQLSDVNRINVRYNLLQALMSKNVDAVTGIMRNFELHELMAKGFTAIAFYPEEHGMPSYDELIFITKTGQENDSRLQKFLNAVQRGVQYLKKNPEKYWQLFIKAHPENNTTVNHEAWIETVSYFANDPAYDDIEKHQKFLLFMKKNHLIKN